MAKIDDLIWDFRYWLAFQLRRLAEVLDPDLRAEAYKTEAALKVLADIARGRCGDPQKDAYAALY